MEGAPHETPSGRVRRDASVRILDNGRRRWQWLASMLSVAFVVMMLLALLPAPAAPFFQGFDEWWHALVAGPPDYQPSGAVAWLNAFGGPPGLVMLPLLIIGLLLARRRWAVLFTVLVYIVPMLFAQLFKNVVDRPRPENPLVMVDHGSFPSGHVTLTAALMVMFIALLSPAVRRYWSPVAVAFVLVMIWSRTFLAAHWLSDTVAGAVLGAGVALMLWWLCAPLLARDDARRNQRKLATTVQMAKLSNTKEPTP
ncbi:phosphatase PAP2 family protein [Paeniglutamicibacter kerguelensis]|nr:phosphatase PAP2 family protein [Paeniglutamicibacter kerguelensis]